MRRRGRGALVVPCLGLLLAACGSPKDDRPPPTPVEFDTAELDRIVERRLRAFREDVARSYASFAKGVELGNWVNALRSDLRELQNTVNNGEIDRFDGVFAEIAGLEQRLREIGRREEEERRPMRGSISNLEKALTEVQEKVAVLEGEVNVAYAELHELREEMLGILGELAAYRKAFREALELRLQTLQKEQQILDRAQVDDSGSD